MQFSVLLAGVVVAGGLWGFIEMAEVARDATPHAFDTQIMLAFREAGRPDNPVGPPWLEEAVRDITSLGSMVVLVLVTASAVFYLLLIGWRRQALVVLVAVGGGQAISSLLKIGVDRPRPDLVSHLVNVQTLSFPSGHAMMAAVTWLTLGSMLAGIVPGRASRIYVLCVAIFVTLLVGLSRVYLGVHWPSDVLAGWCAGFAWAMLCWLVARHLAPGTAAKAPLGSAQDQRSDA
ncbi:MAG: phosphatase PAP2 family protein [Hyphomicrobiales bacterium]|nr:phosphatase PAP2 family protein [Hyphomicrobiales bacterium]